MWIVMTSAAHMPQSCSGVYRNVALVQLNQRYTARGLKPKMISERAKGVLRVRHLGHHNVGKTSRCAYQRALKRAHEMALEWNSGPTVVPELIVTKESVYETWGGSA
jgi:hypothetical protein